MKTKLIYPDSKTYISYADALNVQTMCKELFDNFDGGFGLYAYDEYTLHLPIKSQELQFGFTTYAPGDMELASYSWAPNELSIEDYTPRLKRIGYSIYQVLYVIAKELKIEYSPDKQCIEKCFEEFKKIISNQKTQQHDLEIH
ncbi:MAG TPA: hypothetical protein PKD00_00515 [Burkholderiales bacterium]|nr:hypothetical protein [Burkholderiales bacterium]